MFCATGAMAQKYGIAEHSTPEGIAVGEAAPSIEVTAHSGEHFILKEELDKGPVVLVFYRGNWCPYCSRYLAELDDAFEEVKSLGAQIVGVSPECAEQLLITHEELTGGSITLLYDKDNAIMHNYDVAYEVTDTYADKVEKKNDIDLNDHNEQEKLILPVAATYVINQDGMVSFRHFDLDYSQRAKISEIITALKEL